jgi:hypothetical protein
MYPFTHAPHAPFGSPDEVLASLLKVIITVEGGAESLTCEGETIVVNVHGALIATAIGLSSGMRISVHVYLTNKRAAARVVYVDPKNALHCGIELDEPRNIWGVSLPLTTETRRRPCRPSTRQAP